MSANPGDAPQPAMPSDRSQTELRLLAAAAMLLERGGPAAVTTRAVLEEAGVTAPTLYHHFGDKDGLLDALLEEGVARFLAERAALPETEDAAADLLFAWDVFLDFVSEQPQLFRLLAERALEDAELLTVATKWCRDRLALLQNKGRLKVEVDFGLQALLSVSNGVAVLRAQGHSDTDVRHVGRFVFETTLMSLVRR